MQEAKRKCKKCLIKKPIANFYRRGSDDRIDRVCRDCVRGKIRCHIYIIINPAWEGYIKIGRAKNAENRLKTFQTASPHRDFELYFYKTVDDIYKAEQYFYVNFGNEKGEWIYFSKEKARAIIKSL